MRTLARILFCATCLLTLAVAPAVYADDEDAAPSGRQSAKEKREARRGKDDAPKGSFGKEMAALGEAATMLSKVKDEAAAREAAEKICKKFAALPPILNGSDAELEMLAKAQNRVNDQMERLMSTAYFVPSGLQDAWTLMTDPFSRRSAQKRRRR